MQENQFKEEEFESKKIDITLWKQIFKLLFKHKKFVYGLIGFNIVVTICDVVFPMMNQYAINNFVMVEGDHTGMSLQVFALLYVSLIVAITIGVYGFIRMGGKIENAFSYDIRKLAFEKLQTLPFSYFDKTPSGWIIARMTSDISRLAEIVSWGLLDIFYGIIMITLVGIVMLSINWKLGLMALAVFPVMLVIALWFQRKILVQYRDVRKINSQITSGFSEGISGAKTTKTLSLEQSHDESFRKLTGNMRTKSVKAAYFNALFFPIILSLGSISTALLLWQGGQQALMNAIQFGTLVMFLQYARQFMDPVFMLSGWLAEIQMAQASAERVISLLNTESTLVDSEAVIEKYGTLLNPKEEAYEPIVGDVEFKDVTFHYNPDEPVLTHFNLSVKAGQSIALVGETGSGKSTLVNLLCRFYEPVSGEVLFDGKDYRERSIGWLHSKIGYVLQAPHLFSGSIYENIRFGRLDATREEIIDAAKTVHAYDFIMSMDKGFDSEVGEGGGRLSTGQKQLISFARAVLSNPSIFVLDEATSSIDTETEMIIQDAIEGLMEGKTSFIVAHRLSTIVNCDRILVIDKGRILEDGSHQELMKQKGRYYLLYTNQFHESVEFAQDVNEPLIQGM
ncbi:ABC transporter ATP-binding protein [Erysipelothrix larvae]|uniref:ABC transporter ATP-binding protein n=1 Tax=Erysipelothrix larvae TaxID=1514105 RepID=A0A0X8H0J8_9FIRM|nr:ABC transporter ATP-binding protein [Erysipelothrix larvae]AMC93836.1 ABC transporter ATP-binding protein [Erysipelothrix larvae]